MAIRTIEYAVSVNGIVPASQQFGGTQGDHNATELKFTLSEPLRSAITSSAQGTVVYRFDGYDGSGGVRSTEPQVLTQDPCVYVLEEWITRYGGKVQVYLVITDVTDGTEMELYSFPAVLNIKDRPDGKPTDGSDYDSISTLYEGARASADKAEDAAARAEQVLEDIGGAILDIDVTEVSDGVEITVSDSDGIQTVKVHDGKKGDKGDKGEKGDKGADGTMIFEDLTAEQKASLKGDKGDKGDPGTNGKDGYTPQKGVDYWTDTDKQEIVQQTKDAIDIPTITALLNLVYPVGSIYMSVNDTDPATFIGGTWKRIQDTFLLAAGSKYGAGTTGGEAEHTLTVDEMPSHSHSLSWVGYSSNAPAISETNNGYETGAYVQGQTGSTTYATGSGTAHNNMPPYLAVYVWKRIA